MGIIEAIQEERIRMATEEVAEEVAEEVTEEVTVKVTGEVTVKVTQQVQKDNIQRLYKRGFEIEAISEMLGVPLEFAKDAVK